MSNLLELKKQRFLCRECGQTFIAETSGIEKRCHISNDIKCSLTIQGTRNISEKDIALKHHVSNNTVKRGGSAKMNQALKVFRQSHEAIVNTLNYSYSNGLVEGINNKIKVIKRTVYGYRNFSNFRNRIFIEFKLLEIKTAT